ncbi:MAG: hypothetical protein PHT13_07755 [Methanosarcina sp.]|nr:hypothetical protein [Methanosarcina sp.]
MLWLRLSAGGACGSDWGDAGGRISVGFLVWVQQAEKFMKIDSVSKRKYFLNFSRDGEEY